MVNSQLPADLQGPPDHLSKESRELFENCVATGSYDGPSRVVLIRLCEVKDALTKIRATPFDMCFTDKHSQPRIHPLAKHELALTNELGKLYRLLGYDQAPPDGQFPLFK